jgi:branched-chain amino acid transport system substrate-binding protein
MTLSILMTIVAGSWEEGFLAQLFLIDNGQTRPIRQPFRLPASLSVKQSYDRWQQAYIRLEEGYRQLEEGYRQQVRIVVPAQTTNRDYRSDVDYQQRLIDVKDSYEDLVNQVNFWFEQPEFTRLELELVDRLPQGRPARLVLSTNQESLCKIPWHLWSIYRRRSEIEVVLSGGDHAEASQWSQPVRILTIVGNQDGIDIKPDLESIRQIPNATIEVLHQPNREQLKQTLRSGCWDIIIYVGHSSSNSLQSDGVIVYGDDPQQVIRLSDLESSVKIAVANGLKLMIFNSCDGLGLTQPLLQFGVPNVIVMRESVPDVVAHQFLDNFINAFVNRRLPLSLAIREARVQLKGDDVQDDFPGSQDIPIGYQVAYGEDLCWPDPVPEPVPIPVQPSGQILVPIDRDPPLNPPTVRPWPWKLIAIGLVGLGVAVLWSKIIENLCGLPGLGSCPPKEIAHLRRSPIAERLSLGDRVMIPQTQNPPYKDQGADALRRGNYAEAVRLYSKSLEQHRNDPESVIALNNARALQGPHLQIALAVPIGSNPNVAQEMMRGIAQYQNEVNHGDGINGKQLVVLLANDDNREGPAEAIANFLVADPNILAIVGHNATNASLAAVSTYQKGGLPMVMPTSMATQLTRQGSYIFRATSDSVEMAKTQAAYLWNKGHRTLAICYDASASDNQSYQKELIYAFQRKGGREITIGCDISKPGFDLKEAQAALNDAIDNNVDVIALAPHIDRLQLMKPVLEANQQSTQRRLPLIGSVSLYTVKTLSFGKAIEGMIIPAPWHPQLPEGQHFARKTQQFWGAQVSWRTATTYDATAAVVTGLRLGPSRVGLQQAMRSSTFEAQGSGPPFRFHPVTGERGLEVSLTVVRPSARAQSGYEIVPIPVPDRSLSPE